MSLLHQHRIGLDFVNHLITVLCYAVRVWSFLLWTWIFVSFWLVSLHKRIITDFRFLYHKLSECPGWLKCVSHLTHMESQWLCFPLGAGCQQGSLPLLLYMDLHVFTQCPSHSLRLNNRKIWQRIRNESAALIYIGWKTLRTVDLHLIWVWGS